MVTEIPVKVLEKAVRDLIAFNEFTLYFERDTDECTGITFALEFLYCSLNLNSSHIDSAELIEDLVANLDETEKKLNIKGWESVRANLPFARYQN